MSEQTKPRMPPGTYWEPILGRYLQPTNPSWTQERYEQLAGKGSKESTR